MIEKWMDAQTLDALTKAGGGAVGLWLFVLAIRLLLMRANSRAKVLGARDSAEIDLLAELRTENRMLREANGMLAKERNDALSEIGGLRTEVRGLRDHIRTLENQVADLIQRWPGSASEPPKLRGA